MKVTTVASPHVVQQFNNNADRTAELRTNAVKAFSGQQQAPQQQEHPVQNPNQVSPEELSAIQSPTIPKPDISTMSEDTQQSTDTPEESTQEPAKPEIDQQLRQNFEKLSRQERALRAKVEQQNQRLAEREDSLKAREQEWADKEATYRRDYVAKAQIKQDALTILDEQGVTYDDITQQAVNRQPTDPRVLRAMNNLQDQVQTLTAKLEQAAQQQTKAQESSVQAALRQIELDVTKTVRNNPDFELIDKQGRIKSVVKLIKDTYDTTGEVLDAHEAAEMYEQELLDRAMNSYTSIQKIQKRVSEASAKAKEPQKTQTPTQQTPQMKTLTNAAGANRKLSVRERAMLAFKGELGKG